MRKQVAFGLVALLAGSTLAARAARAQEAAAVEFSLGGGIDLPLGDFDDIAKPGFHGVGAVSFVPSAWPLGIQIDGTYGQLADDTPLEVKFQTIYGTANLVYKFKTAEHSKIRPYLIGGGGVYNVKFTGDDVPAGIDNSTTKFGMNAGAGFAIKAGSAGLFAEARFHRVFNTDIPAEGDDTNFLPITVGVRFGGS
jgi:Outer membrane protein beta-barrel domain